MLNKPAHQTYRALRGRGLFSNNGFTLLEILVVIGLLSILALGMTAMLEDDGHWRRDDVTEERWQRIRKAIIGEPNLTLNGSPQVAGYVADMGRLPFYISELTTQSPIFDQDNDGVIDNPCSFNSVDIEQPDYDDIAISGYVANTASGFVATVSGGWRGPYLHTEGSRFFGDGWFGFRDADTTFNPKDTQSCDFAWRVVTTPPPPPAPATINFVDALEIQSLGKDRVAGGTASAEDYPQGGLNMINFNEWTLSAAPITFNIQFNRSVATTDIPVLSTPAPNTPHSLQLAIYRYTDNGDAVADANDINEERAVGTFTLSTGMTLAPAQTISLSGEPIGRYAAVIWCTNNTHSNLSDDVVYDGNCDATGGINHSPVYFTLTQSTSQVTIVWNLP